MLRIFLEQSLKMGIGYMRPGGRVAFFAIERNLDKIVEVPDCFFVSHS